MRKYNIEAVFTPKKWAEIAGFSDLNEVPEDATTAALSAADNTPYVAALVAFRLGVAYERHLTRRKKHRSKY